jgi:ribosomal protein S18 acetylase RimI-like enzyme
MNKSYDGAINLIMRVAGYDDISGICLLNEEFWRYNAKLQPDYYCPSNDNGTYPKSVMESEDSDLIIALEEEKIVGLIHVRESKTLLYDTIVQHRFAEVVDFIVTESHRRIGIGLMLMDAGKEWSKDRNLEYIELFVLSEAVGEKLFYEKEGFKTVSYNMRYEL